VFHIEEIERDVLYEVWEVDDDEAAADPNYIGHYVLTCYSLEEARRAAANLYAETKTN
jgi:hypothetical protein